MVSVKNSSSTGMEGGVTLEFWQISRSCVLFTCVQHHITCTVRGSAGDNYIWKYMYSVHINISGLEHVIKKEFTLNLNCN